MIDELASAVASASIRPQVRAAINAIHIDLQRQIDLRRPICTSSGRCCRFDEFGHRLYVTTLELAAFTASLREVHATPPDNPAAAGALTVLASGPVPPACPFQVDSLCSVHLIRPFGCRIFFCDATVDDWQKDQYELFHARLKQLHRELEVPYFYIEWREALRRCNLAPPSHR
jgi:Fe-S-cluster containining protein